MRRLLVLTLLLLAVAGCATRGPVGEPVTVPTMEWEY